MPFKVQTLGISNAAMLKGIPKTGDMLTFHAYSDPFILSVLTSAIRGTRPVYMTEISDHEVKDGEWFEPLDPNARLIGLDETKDVK